MSFLISCPNCGDRNVNEFQYGGEVTSRPAPEDGADQWTDYFYSRKNTAGVAREWWNHRYGCRKWFFALRDTTNNQVSETYWP